MSGSTYPSDEDVIELSEISGKSWEKHPEETDKAYNVFDHYLRLGRGRTVKEAYLNAYGKSEDEIDRVPTHISAWKKQFAWDKRCERWDKVMDEKKRERHQEAILEQADRNAENAKLISTAILENLRQKFEGATPKEIVDELEGLDLESAARVLSMVQSIEEKARGKVVDDEDEEQATYIMMLQNLEQEELQKTKEAKLVE